MTPITGAIFAIDWTHLDPPYWVSTLIKVGIVAVLIPTTALILGIVFLFKVMSWMQSRLGPQEAGPKGLLQLLADGVKFIQKQDIVPDAADRFVFKVAPMVVLISTFLLYVILPGSPHFGVNNELQGGVFFALAMSSLSVIGILMAGWGSANKFALMSGIRAAGQLIAYELPMVLAVVGVVIQAGSLNLNEIIIAQSQFSVTIPFTTASIPFPLFIVTQFPMFLVFLAAAQAELTQPPFDMPVAESELVGGYQVEYSGFRFLFFFMGEFATAFAFAALASVLFLGGWHLPGLDVNSDWYWLIGPGVLFTKIMAVSFLIFWFRFTYPRLREDQLQKICWKYLIPICLVWVSVTAVAKVVW